MDIKIKYHDKEIPKLEQIEQGCWIDLRASETVELKTGELALIPLGISMQLPPGYEAIIAPRSSTAIKFGIIQANHIGIIDTSYCGDNDIWKFPAIALRDTVIKKGSRICQFRIQKTMDHIRFIEVESLNNENRGGFGSTGME